MPTFILRAIDADLWSRVTAKAAAEGCTVKQLVLKALAQYVAIVVLVLLTTACGASNPTQATPIADPAAAPASISLTSVSGQGATTGQVYVSAMVKDASGKGVGAAIVTFTTTAGTFLATPITSDGGGLAQASLTTIGNATITARVGTVSSALDVVPTAAPGPMVPTPPVYPPAQPTPPVPPTPPIGVATVGCTTAIGAMSTACNVSVVYNNQAIASTAITRVDWDWGDGTVVPVGGGSLLGDHLYAQAGAYRVGVTVSVTIPNVGPIQLSTGTSVVVPGPKTL
jgi:hypothetical protein